METRLLPAHGAAVYWRNSLWYDRQALFDGLAAMGLARFCPPNRSYLSCLFDALRVVYGSNKGDHRIEPLADDEGAYEVTKIIKGKERNIHARVASFKVSNERHITMEPLNPDVAPLIVSAFSRHMLVIRSDKVADMLVSIIKMWGGQALRPSGAFYWLEESKLSEWEQLGYVLSSACVSGQARLFSLSVAMTASTASAVIDALTEEVMADVKALNEEIAKGDLGERALKNRRDIASRIADRVEHYEQMFERPLPLLREHLESVGMAAAHATILVAAQQNGGFSEEYADD